MTALAATLAGLSFDTGIAGRVDGSHRFYPFAAHRLAHALAAADPALTVARATRALAVLTFPDPPTERRRGSIFGWPRRSGHIVFTSAAREQIAAEVLHLKETR
ncbi:MAG: hypothetical protein ACOYM5_02925 [Caulobacter sp.]